MIRERESDPRTAAAVATALSIYAIWVLATYLLEGRPRTLLRPEAQGLRIAYTAVANLAIGLVGSALVLRRLIARGVLTARQAGFRNLRRTLFTALVGLGLGLASYWIPHPLASRPMAVLNVFAQVWPVSSAEVLVCWAVAGSLVHAVWPGPARTLVAAVAASVLFGLYHVAHSPPFNTPRMVVLLTAVGMATSLFFFLVRDVYGTIAFHTGLALIGVMGALDRSGELSAFDRPIAPLWAMALGALVLLVVLHRAWLRSDAESRAP
jgi:hypothetical protein